jgi:hypothetical protein
MTCSATSGGQVNAVRAEAINAPVFFCNVPLAKTAGHRAKIELID